MPKKSPNNELAAWLAAVAEPTRITIIRLLAAGEKTVTDLAKLSKIELVNTSSTNFKSDNGTITLTAPDGKTTLNLSTT